MALKTDLGSAKVISRRLMTLNLRLDSAKVINKVNGTMALKFDLDSAKVVNELMALWHTNLIS